MFAPTDPITFPLWEKVSPMVQRAALPLPAHSMNGTIEIDR